MTPGTRVELTCDVAMWTPGTRGAYVGPAHPPFDHLVLLDSGSGPIAFSSHEIRELEPAASSP